MDKTVIRFFTIADFEEEEIWLREQHKAGWKLVKMTPPCLYRFEACEPEDVIYRLDYRNSEQTEEYMQMVKDFGWEYFGQCLGWLYFRKPADAAESAGDEELFSDSISRAEMVSHIVRTRLFPLLIIFLCGIIPNLLNAFGGRLGAASSFFGIVFSVMFLLYMYLIIHCSIKLKKIRDR